MIRYRQLNSGEEQDAYSIIAQAYAPPASEYLAWRFFDNPSWKYEYSTVAEIDGEIVAVFFLEPQVVTFMDGFLDIVVGGGGAVHAQYRRKGYYKMMNTLNIEKTRGMGKDLYVAHAMRRDVVYESLKKKGFFPLGVQSHFIKILSVRETVHSVMELVNQKRVPESLTMRIRISPLVEAPFIVQVKNGTFSVEEDSLDSDMDLTGDIEKAMIALVEQNFRMISVLLLKKKIRVRIRVSSIVRLARLTRAFIKG